MTTTNNAGSYNNAFGNNNQIIVNGEASADASPPPPASVAAVCGLTEETITMGRFPPEDLPAWGWPFQIGTAGYPGADGLAIDELDPAIVAQSYNLPPYGISCLGFRGLVKALAEDIKFGDPNPQLTDNSLFGLPHPRDVNVSGGQTYMDLYIPWKQQTASLPNTTAAERHIKYVREGYSKLIDGFMFILAFEQWTAHSAMGTKYAADLIFVTAPEITPLVSSSGGYYDLFASADLFPFSRFNENMLALAEEQSRPYRHVGLLESGPQGRARRGDFRRLLLQRRGPRMVGHHGPRNTATGRRLAAFEEPQADYADTLAERGTKHVVAPSYTPVPPGAIDSRRLPDRYHICKDARLLYDYMKDELQTQSGVVCARAGRGPHRGVQQALRIRDQGGRFDDAAACDMPAEVSDIAYTAINAIDESQVEAYGLYGTLLTPEQTRVMVAWTMRILYKHVGNQLGDAVLRRTRRMVARRRCGLLSPEQRARQRRRQRRRVDCILLSKLGVLARASVAEMKAIYDDITKAGICDKIPTTTQTMRPTAKTRSCALTIRRSAWRRLCATTKPRISPTRSGAVCRRGRCAECPGDDNDGKLSIIVARSSRPSPRRTTTHTSALRRRPGGMRIPHLGLRMTQRITNFNSTLAEPAARRVRTPLARQDPGR